MTIDEMKKRKKELGYSYAQISELSGVPLGTVQKVFSGVTASPRYDTLYALERILGKGGRQISEEAFEYLEKDQGEYTLEDYYQLPEDVHMELIDGVIYNMSLPSSIHQLLCGLIYGKLLGYVSTCRGSCVPMISPIDVQLDCDEKTMVQPDIAVVCDRNKIMEHCIYGAPDFIIEVLSPTTKKRDSIIKLNKYMSAGVREYWLIDPDKKIVIVYDFEHEEYPAIYGFDSRVPVHIWDKKCEINFQEIYEYIRFLYEK